MPRLQINMTGTSLRVGATWTVTGQWALSTGPSSPAALATILATIRTSLAASTPFKQGIGSNFSLVNLHGLYYPTPLGPASFVADAGGTAVAGTALPGPIPLAVVVSERTNASGPSYRGRSYWPNGAGGTDGSISTGTQSAVSASWLAWHGAVNSALSGAGLSPVHVVFSRKLGDMTPISYIQLGNRIDTARGRFGDTPESYTTYTVPTSVSAVQGQATGDQPGAGLPDSITQEEAQQIVDEAIHNLGGITLGPLKEVIPAVAQAVVIAAEETPDA